MSGLRTVIQRLVRRWFPAQTYERGWGCADKCIINGGAPSELRGQACVDLHPDPFTRGWKARCDAAHSAQIERE